MQDLDSKTILDTFARHYGKRLGNVHVQTIPIDTMQGYRYEIVSPVLRGKGNYPFLLTHDRFSDHVVVLTHGLSDSPHYMEAIGWRFFYAGANVVFPLLYGHGQKYPDKAMQASHLCEKWQSDMDQAIEVAQMLGKHISLGGLSTGGALSLNAILRHKSKITGGLYLFAAALEIGKLYENIGRLPLFQTFYRLKQERVIGNGPNPYKFPIFSNFSGLQLARLIQENKRLLKNTKIKQPVFAAHSVQDISTLVSGVIELLDKHVTNGVAYLISSIHDGQPMAHADLVLEHPIALTTDNNPYNVPAPKANPKFDDMMCAAIRFFKGNLGSDLDC